MVEKEPNRQVKGPKAGAKVSVPSIKWDNGTTLMLVLQKGCRYCEESAAFRDRRVGRKA